jgi:hypothetical protein
VYEAFTAVILETITVRCLRVSSGDFGNYYLLGGVRFKSNDVSVEQKPSGHPGRASGYV